MPSPRVSGARFDQLMQQATEPAFWLTADLKLAWVNQAWEKLTGFPAADALGLICRAHGPSREGDLTGLAGSLFPPAEALAGKPCSTKTMIVQPSGERVWRRVEYRPFHDPDGRLIALLGLVRNHEEASNSPDSESQRLRVELMEIRDRLLTRRGSDQIVGSGPAHLRLLNQISAAAATTVPLLIIGEPGTGRRLVARSVHLLSERREFPMISLDCTALPFDVLERELFNRPPAEGEPTILSRLAGPEGSSLLIGDVADLPRDLQGRLTRALDGKTRLIAISATEPETLLKSERHLREFYYALTGLVIRLAPLRERLDELPLLAQNFLERHNQRSEKPRHGFTEAALAALATYDWPGNLRELSRAIEIAYGRGSGDLIDVEDLPAAIRGHLASAFLQVTTPEPQASLDEMLTQVERRLIENALARYRHNKSKAAEELGISRPRLYRRIKELNLPDLLDGPEEPAVAAGHASDVD